MIDEREFADWLQHPVTIAFRQVLASKRADLRNEWETSDPSAYTKEQFVLANVGNIGWCRGLSFAETFDYEQYLTETENDKRIRAEAPGSGGVD